MILKEEVASILDARNHYRTAEAYYEGTVPEVFTSSKLRALFKNSGFTGQLNVCRPVVDAVANRLELAGVVAKDDITQSVINKIWEDNDLTLEADEVHRKALTYGDAYVFVWPDEEGNILVSVASPLVASIVYDPENPRKKLYAVKMWSEGDRTRLNVYTSTEVRKFRSQSEMVTDGTQWSLIETVENPFGEVPVFHFRTHRPYGRPEHYDGYECQDAITKHFAMGMYVADYQGAPQRYALLMNEEGEVADFNEGDTTRENAEALENGPGQMWFLKGVHGVGQFQPASPEAFWTPIKNTLGILAALTHTPVHYFEKAANIQSGQGLRAAEGPLLKKVKARQQSFGQTWREMFRFMLRLHGIDADVTVKWEEPEYLDGLDDWDVMLKKINAGLSHRQALREAGYDEELIERIMQERAREAEDGSYYQRKPEARVNTNKNETYEGETK